MDDDVLDSETEERIARIQDVIRSFVRKYQFVHEYRLHKLLFCAEFTSYQYRRKPILGAGFKRYYHGVYSDLVNLALSRMDDLRTEPDETPDGKPTFRYVASPEMKAKDLSAEDHEIIERTHYWTRSMTNDQLAAFGKSTSAWAKAEFGEDLELESMAMEPGFVTTADDERDLLAAKAKILRGEVESFDDIEDLLRADDLA